MTRRALALFLVACGGARGADPSPTVVLPTPAEPDAGAQPTAAKPPPSTASGCLASLDGVTWDDPKLSPKRIDERKLAADLSHSPDPVEAAYARARFYFEANHWLEAAEAFRGIAFDHPESDIGIYAAQLYLESINVVGTHANRDECYDVLARDVPALTKLYCTTSRQTNAEACGVFEKLPFQLDRLAADRALAAAKKNPLDKTGFVRAGARYEDVARKYCLSGASPERCDEVVYNGAVVYLEAGDKAHAEGLRAILADPKNKMNKSPLLKKLSCQLDGPSSPPCK